LLEIIIKNPHLTEYVPDEVNLNAVPRNFLLAVCFNLQCQIIFNIDTTIWQGLCDTYHKIEEFNRTVVFSNMQIEILPRYTESLSQFCFAKR